jgi:hypothetical protein
MEINLVSQKVARGGEISIPKNETINKVLLLGSGAIKIGEAGESQIS